MERYPKVFRNTNDLGETILRGTQDERKTKKQLINELEEMRQLITELEVLETEHKKMAESMNLLSTAVRTSVDAISVASPFDGKLIFCNDAFLKWWKVKGDYHNLHYTDCFDVDSNVLEKAVQATMKGNWSGELRAKAMDGQTFPVLVTSSSVVDKGRRVIGLLGIFKDITKRKRAEEALKEREKELEIKTSNLEEVNAALKVLLEKRDEDRTELEEKVLFNIKELVTPYLEKLKKSALDEKQKAYFSILESNLTDIISPFSRRMSTKYLNLTPGEIQVANLVRQGKTSKEIADLFNLSVRTIEAYRNSIRRKIGIKHKKANLRTHLLSIQ